MGTRSPPANAGIRDSSRTPYCRESISGTAGATLGTRDFPRLIVSGILGAVNWSSMLRNYPSQTYPRKHQKRDPQKTFDSRMRSYRQRKNRDDAAFAPTTQRR